MSRGYVDPRVSASTQRETWILKEVRRRGLSLHKLHGAGEALRLTGPNVHIVVAGLRDLQPADLKAPQPKG